MGEVPDRWLIPTNMSPELRKSGVPLLVKVEEEVESKELKAKRPLFVNRPPTWLKEAADRPEL